jgi:dienelactone hydrolase
MKKIFAGALFLASFQAGIPSGANAQAILGSTGVGPFAAGFQLLERDDPARAFSSGDPAVSKSRPMRIYIWYPAVETRGPAMKIGDFVRMAADDFSRTAEASGNSRVEDKLPVPLAKGLDRAQLKALLEAPLRSVSGAAARPETFPLIVLGQGLYYESPLSHVFLCEYLAGRGFVVATCPLVGTYHRLMNLGVEDLETAVRDLEFTAAEARNRPGVRPHSLGVIGYDIGGMAGLILTMRNPNVDAFLSLDSGILTPHGSGLPGSHPNYREERFTVPWMHMTQERFVETARRNPAARTLIDRKPFGDSYLVSVRTDNHGLFSSYAKFGIGKEVPGYWGPIEGDPGSFHDELCRLAGSFFDGYLKNDEKAIAGLKANTASSAGRSGVRVELREGAPPPPSGASLIHLIIEKGIEGARPIIDRTRDAFPGRKVLDESELNWLGYHFLLWWGREKEAVEVFRLNAELNPGSANAFDSLGEACLVLGRTEEAIAAYRKSLELNPKNPGAAAALEKLTKKKTIENSSIGYK